MKRVRSWLERWNGFPDWVTPLVVVVALVIAISGGLFRNYIIMALLLFFCIYMELRQIRNRLGTMKVELTLPKKEEG